MLFPAHYHNITAKTGFYFSNGSGRDSYIVSQNPCMTVLPKIDKSNLHQTNQNISFKYKINKFVMPSLVESKVTHYVSDGSGRDNYIKFNEGGQVSNFDCKYKTNIFFESSLRKYNKPSNIPPTDFFMLGQVNHVSPSRIRQTKQTLKLQIDQKNRLSKPKFVREKPLRGNNKSSLDLGSSKLLKTDSL